MRRFITMALLLSAGCAPVNSSAPRTTTSGRNATIRGEVNNAEGYEFLVSRTVSAHAITLPTSMDRGWSALVEAFREMSIPTTYVDHSRRELGNRELVIRGRLGKEPLSRLVDCGTVLGGPIANTYRVRLAVVSALEASDPDGVRLVTQVGATASDPGSSSSAVSCTSTGELEKRIAAATVVGIAK